MEEKVTINREKGMADGKQMIAQESMERGMMNGTMELVERRRRSIIGGRVLAAIDRRR